MATLAEELAALVATFPNAAFESHLTASRAEIDANTGVVDESACLVALFTSAVQANVYNAATATANAQTTVLIGQTATINGQITALNAQIDQLQAEYDFLVANPDTGPSTPQTPLPAPGSALPGDSTYAWPTPTSNVWVVQQTGALIDTTRTTNPVQRTLAAAITAASSGDKIVLKAGNYHESIGNPGKNLIIQAAPGEAVWFDGSVDSSGGWINTAEANTNHYYKTGVVLNFQHSIHGVPFGGGGEYALNADGTGTAFSEAASAVPTASYPEMVLRDTAGGSNLTQMVQKRTKAELTASGHFYYDTALDRMYVYGDPNTWTVRIADLQQFMQIDSGAITLRGVGVRRYATQALNFGTISCKGADSFFENVWFEDSSYEGLFLNLAHRTNVERCTFLRCGKCGMGCNDSDDLVLKYNRWAYNNFSLYSREQEAGGIKMVRCIRALVEGNLCEDNWGHGIWLDIFCNLATIVRNTSRRNADSGIHYEISLGTAWVTGNILHDNGYAGLQISDSPDVNVWNNTIVNNRVRQFHYGDDQRADAVPTSPRNCLARNNILAGHDAASEYLVGVVDLRLHVRTWNADVTPYTYVGNGTSGTFPRGMNWTSDYNAFWRKTTATDGWARFCNAGTDLFFTTLAQLRAGGIGQDTHSIEAALGGTNPFVSVTEAAYTGPGPMGPNPLPFGAPGTAQVCVSGTFAPTALVAGKGTPVNATVGGQLGVPAGTVDIGAVQNPGIDSTIVDGRAALVAAGHYLLPTNADWTGVVDASSPVQFVVNAIPNGTAAKPITIDYWPDGDYLQDSDTLSTGRNYTTINLHGATVRTKPAIDLGTCTTVAGSTDVVSAAGGPWTTAQLIGRSFITRGLGKVRSESMIVGVVSGGTLQPFASGTTSRTFRLASAALAANAQPSLAVSGGDPGTPDTISTYPRVRTRKLFTWSNCTNCRLTGLGAGTANGSLVGALPVDWNNTTPGLTAVPNFEADLDGQAGVGLFGSVQFQLDHVIFADLFGGGARVASYVSGTTTIESSAINFNHCSGDRLGGSPAEFVRGTFLTLADSVFTNLGRGGVDLVLAAGIAGLNVLRNQFGLSPLPCVFVDAPGTLNSVAIKDNVGLARPFDIRVVNQSYATTPWTGWDVEGNVGYVAPIANRLPTVQTGAVVVGSAASFSGLNGLIYTGNTQDFKASGSSLAASDMVHVVGERMTGLINVSANTGTNARAQSKINGVLSGAGRVGIPASNAYFGGAVDPKPPTGGSQAAATAALEARFGAGYVFACHRVYVPPAGLFLPSYRQSDLDDDRAKGRMTWLSLALPAGETWTSMAANTTLLQNAANGLKTLTDQGCQIVLIADHEPDVTENPGGGITIGTQASRFAFAAFTTAFFTRVRNTAPLVTRVVDFGGYKLFAGVGGITVAQTVEFLPTDKSLVEMLGTNPYNSATGPNSTTFAQSIVKHSQLLAAYGCPGFIGETGRTAASGVEWWRGVFAEMQLRPQYKAVLFFHSGVGATDPVHDYWIDDTTAEFADIRSTTVGSGQGYFHPSGSVAPPPPPPGTPVVKVSGNSLVDKNGIKFIAKGTSISGPEYEPSQNQMIWPPGFVPNQAFIDKLKAWKINMLRIPIQEWSWLGLNTIPGGGTMQADCCGAAYRNEIIALIDLCGANDIYVIFEDHWNAQSLQPGFNASGGQCNGQGCGPTSKTLSFWQDAAARLKDKPWVIFELFNEPTAAPGVYFWQHAGTGLYNYAQGGPRTADNVKAGEGGPREITHVGFQVLIDAIRAASATNVIGLPGMNFQQTIAYHTSLNMPNAYNGYTLSPLPMLTDPQNQMVLCAHWYPESGVHAPQYFDEEVNYTPNGSNVAPHVGGTNYTMPMLITETGPTGQDSPGNMHTTGTSTLPGTLNMVPGSIPRVGVTQTDLPCPSAAETAGLPNGAEARKIRIAGVGLATYTDIVGNTFTGVSGVTATVGAGVQVTIEPVQPSARVGFVLSVLAWLDKRNLASAGTPGTRTGQRFNGMIAWNWAPVGQSGPELLQAAGTDTLSYSQANPTNWGYVFKQWSPNG